MKLTRLRLIGFKSFVEPTDFVIEPGLTGVVGPNGCGKSNLVEAVRWVMGEASYKAMRASEMDDVIFSGNNQRPARNHAEVAVQVDNSERNAPAAFNDAETLEVSRRIVREQGSTFRVNGREVRARDVGVLFADASTGSRSPALVHQGRIGEIIQARPEQRRRVLEEAAGISGLHARRHEAELRLKAAEANLTRVEDVIGQLAAQTAALKTQARQAVRYRNISGQVRRTEALLFHLRWTAAGIEVTDAEHAQDEAVRVVAARVSEQTQASTRQTELAAGLPALREGEAKAAAALQRLIVARETLEREEARAKERISELDRRLEQFTADLEREQTLAADAAAALERLDSEESTLKAEAQANALRLSGVNERVETADAALAVSERSFAELTGALADLTARRNQLQTALRDHGERAEKFAAELVNIEAGLVATGSGAPDLPALTVALTAAQAALAEAESVARASEVTHIAAREQMDAARGPLVATERAVQRLETEAKTIGKLLAVENKNLWPPVMDALTVANDYEKALGAALGDDLDAPVGDTAPMRWGGAANDPTDPALPEGAVALSQFVQGAAGTGAAAGADRRGRAHRRARLAQHAQARPAAGLARRRPVALGRLRGRRPRTDRRGAPARRARPFAGHSRRTHHRARNDVEAKREVAAAAEAAVAAAAAAETAGPRRMARGAARRPTRRARGSCRRRTRGRPQYGADFGADRSARRGSPPVATKTAARAEAERRCSACRPRPTSKRSSPASTR